jgi:hypothetical protein
MSDSSHPIVDFGNIINQLNHQQMWEYDAGIKGSCQDVAAETFACLHAPLDFPPLEQAIIPGDRVALAVDVNVPAIQQVVQGAIRAVRQAGDGEIDIVVSDETTKATLDAIANFVDDKIRVTRHECSKRESLRYLGADEGADPIYLNRWLVDADFVLPIVAVRSLDANCDSDLTGIFPAFADSRARRRYLNGRESMASEAPGQPPDTDQPAWLLGIQIMLCVTANHQGMAGEILSGTPDAVRKQLVPARRLPDDFPPSAPLVIAALDGNAQQQTWANAARGVSAAARYTLPGGTIVLWGAISDAIAPVSSGSIDDGELQEEGDDANENFQEDFPIWNADESAAKTLARIGEEYRLLIHSELNEELIESMGFAAINSVDELNKLIQSFESCGVIRAAQFAGTTVDQASVDQASEPS